MLVAVCPIAFAHHSLSSEFELSKRTVLSGVISRVEWSNPHAWIFLDVVDPRTKNHVEWQVQLPGPDVFTRLGWHRELFKSGKPILVTAYLARDGSRKGCAQEVTANGGTKIYRDLVSSSEGGK
jgi:hypothetical protein